MIFAVALTVLAVIASAPVMLPVVEILPNVPSPVVATLPPVILPVAVINPLAVTLTVVILAATFTVLAKTTLAPVILPPVNIRSPPVPAVIKFAALTLPETVSKLDDLSKVNPALAPSTSPVSLYCTSVILPAASILPLMLPTKLAAVIVPAADTLPAV